MFPLGKRRRKTNELKLFALTASVGAWDLEMEAEKVEDMMGIMNRVKRRFPDFIKGYESMVITRGRNLSYIAPRLFSRIW
ncbi:hypothetical protein GF412_05590 [Candidatus Micrarchaeota archaeon]|nr:hypothetical protein [Candidatus Micrarchaeota archaeon]MBD3418422.1 hypothetical protein [Candidatus Micrarchaeota archaeon]